jgi:integrase
VSAQENCVAALRTFFALAVSDKLITSNPASDVSKPGRLASNRRAFSDRELDELFTVTANGGNDPVLDTLLLRFHLETGARRGGAIALTRDGIDTQSQCVQLKEKGDTVRWQPISKTLLDALMAHIDTRGTGGPMEPVFRNKPRKGTDVGTPISRKRYNSLVNRWKKSLPWVRQYGVSIHWCRHHATSNIERLAGYAVARQFAGHSSGGEVTTTYIKALPHEVARAVEDSAPRSGGLVRSTNR